MPNRMNDGARSKRALNRMTDFVGRVWAADDPEHFHFLAARDPTSGAWSEGAVRGESEVARFSRQHPAERFDLYFCPNPFCRAKRRAGHAAWTTWGWSDIDEGDPAGFDPRPSIVWRTSPGRTQALWRWARHVPPRTAEAYSKALAYRGGADRTGWSITKMLRIPGSINHKRAYGKPAVELLEADWTPQSRRPRHLEGDVRRPVLEKAIEPGSADAAAVIAKFRKKLHPKARYLARCTRVTEPDRSAQIYQIIAGFAEAGATPEEIAVVLLVNPFFMSKHGVNPERAEVEINRVLSKLGV